MISGRQALAQIEGAVAQARRDEAALDGRLRATAERAARLRAERTEAFRELARLKLDILQREPAIGALDAAERRALAILSSRREALDGLTRRRAEATAVEERAEAERHARAQAVEEALDAVGDLRARVEAEVKVSPEWAAQRPRIDAAAAVAAQAEQKAVQAETDRIEKGRPYDEDPLFQYLWRKRFGTAEDRSGPFVRFFDRKVARHIGYDRARANYTLLTEIPGRLREHAARVGEEIAAERARLTALERAALVEAGIEPLEAGVGEARAALAEAERALAETRAELARFDQEHDGAMLSGGSPFSEAAEVLAEADARQDLQTLYREAMQTPTTRDEVMVQRIEGTERAIGEAEQQLGAVQQELRAVAQRRVALERERDEFRRQGYDRPYSGFRNEQVLGNVLGGILGGIIQGVVLRDVLRDGHQRQPGPFDGGFGGGGAFGGGGGFEDLSPFQDGGGSWGGGGGGDDGFSTGGSV